MKKKKTGSALRHNRWGYFFLIPFFAVFVIFQLIPLVTTIYNSFFEHYFKNELAAGTPFTTEGASELLRLGICTICVPLGAIVVAQTCNALARQCLANVAEIQIDGGAPVVLGVAFIIMSLVCKYGAELKNGTTTITAS